eukprot:Seg2726.8 transcript_id=Seg2726.8/GoldUCD/mRNA.D3Y31 product="hypothetical protein" protein_id=Seg2726.8/GoldUCD/D3Y31
MIVVVVWETKSEEKISHPPCVEVLRRDSLISEGKKNKEGKEMVKMQVKTDLFSGYIHSSHATRAAGEKVREKVYAELNEGGKGKRRHKPKHYDSDEKEPEPRKKSTRSLKEATPDSESSVSNDKSEDEIDTSEDERTTDAEDTMQSSNIEKKVSDKKHMKRKLPTSSSTKSKHASDSQEDAADFMTSTQKDPAKKVAPTIDLESSFEEEPLPKQKSKLQEKAIKKGYQQQQQRQEEEDEQQEEEQQQRRQRMLEKIRNVQAFFRKERCEATVSKPTEEPHQDPVYDHDLSQFLESNSQAEGGTYSAIPGPSVQYATKAEFQELRDEVILLGSKVKEIKRKFKAFLGEGPKAIENPLEIKIQAIMRRVPMGKPFVAVYEAMTEAFTEEEILTHSVSGKPGNNNKKAKPIFDPIRFGTINKVLAEAFPELRDRNAFTNKVHAVIKRIERKQEKGNQGENKD